MAASGAQVERVECPRCGYDLLGVVASWGEACPLEVVCSECGLGMRMAEVLNPRLSVPRWGYEHAETGVRRRLVGTWARSLAPWAFWREVRLEHPLRVRRLVVGLVAMLVGFQIAIMAMNAAMRAVIMRNWGTSVPPEMSGWLTQWSTVWPYMADRFGFPVLVEEPGWVVLVWAVLAPPCVLLLPQTMRECRVKRAHVLRIGVFTLTGAAAVVVLIGAATAAAMLGRQGLIPGGRWTWRVVGDCVRERAPMVLILGGAWMAAAWWAVCVRYLRLPHGRGVAAGVVVMSGLAALAVVAYWPGSGLYGEAAAWITWWW